MRKKSENSQFLRAKAGIPPDEDDDFTVRRRSQNARIDHVAIVRSTPTWNRAGLPALAIRSSHSAILPGHHYNQNLSSDHLLSGVISH